MSYFNDLFLRDKHLQKTISEMSRTQIAENTPSYLHSGEYLTFSLDYSSPHEAIAALLVMSLVTKERDNTMRRDFLEEMAKRLYCYSYQGKWEVVQDILERPLTPYNIITIAVSKLSLREVKGNILPLVPKLYGTYKVKRRQVRLIEKPRKIKYPQRKRGYDDKGSLRLDHEIHDLWEFEGANPQRIDRRNKLYLARNQYYWVPTKNWREAYD